MFIRGRTPLPVILYGVYLVFEGLSHEQNWLGVFNLHEQPRYLKLITKIKEVIGLG